MKRRIITLICIVAMCLSVTAAPVVVHAASFGGESSSQIEMEIPNQLSRWVNTDSITLNINFSSGTAYCSGVILGNTNVKKIEATFQLLKKNSSGQFVPEGSAWPKVTANSDYLTWSGSRTVSAGVYRLQVTATLTNTSNVSETVTTYCEKEYK